MRPSLVRKRKSIAKDQKLKEVSDTQAFDQRTAYSLKARYNIVAAPIMVMMVHREAMKSLIDLKKICETR